jgi:hypothetical protein
VRLERSRGELCRTLTRESFRTFNAGFGSVVLVNMVSSNRAAQPNKVIALSASSLISGVNTAAVV